MELATTPVAEAAKGQGTDLGGSSPDAVAEMGAAGENAASDAEASESETPPSTGSSGRSEAVVRRRWPVLAAASAAILAIGLGIGWGVWGWDAEAYALATAHADQRAELEADDVYDSGTVIPVAEQYGVVIWRAERSDGDEVCVIVTGTERAQNGCIPSKELENSVWPNATATIPEGEDKAGQQLVAGLIPTLTGELVPFIQVWDQGPSGWESQYSDGELAQLRELEAAGYVGSALSIIGYDGEHVVWGNWEQGGLCVIAPADGGVIEACSEDAEAELTIVAVVDGVPTEYVVRQTEMRGPQLTIIRHADATDVRVDPETDDPIEFTFDDLVGGETGETGTTDETGG
ncbi:hypothetical protein [Microbacterium murale]|uniref:Uncharacterized protein n=1 Tax=Microbacterium murale TaxID=1081040 RepID=A0ABU0PBC5_9MICO|nr:hypothetical protein [Microbacterium murale]MDQ0644640.1 hypothetical protein [Microbacterium murale]